MIHVEIEQYLKDRAERRVMTLDWKQWYKNLHSERDRERHDLRGMTVVPPHRHGSNPFCAICDGEIKMGEEFYIFFVGGGSVENVTPYHIKCVNRNSETQEVRALVQQDRAFRYGTDA